MLRRARRYGSLVTVISTAAFAAAWGMFLQACGGSDEPTPGGGSQADASDAGSETTSDSESPDTGLVDTGPSIIDAGSDPTNDVSLDSIPAE